ncbi:MAG: acyltransferase family protein [Actinomycetota bacterium]
MPRRDVLRRPTGSGRVAHVAALDGVRGLAVLAVVVYHLDPDVLPGGFLGVSLFFTLSGFLITNLLVAEWRETGTIDVGSFWSRRFRRLLPASLAGIALVVVLSPAWTASQLADLPGDVAGALGYVANWRFIAGGDRYGAGFEAPSPLLHYWSLAIEEQFYLVVGALTAVLAAGRSLRRWFVVFGLLGVASIVATLALYDPLQTDRIYFGSLTRTAELVAGVLLALAIGFEVPARLKVAARFLGAAALAAAVTAFVVVDLGTSALYRGGLWLMAGSSVLIITGALVDGPLRRALSWRPLTTLGLVSYGIYVYHWPLFLWLDPDRTGLDGWSLAVVRLAATAAVTMASFVWLERPIREARFAGRQLIGLGVAATALVAGGAWLVAQDSDERAVAGEAPAIVLSAEPETPATTAAPEAAVGDDATAEPTTDPDDATAEAATADAAEPPTTTTTAAPDPLGRVVIMGDSLVHQAYPTIDDRLAQAGIESALIGGPGETLMTDQGVWLDELDEAVAVHDPDLVILQSCCGTGDPRRPDPYLDADGVELVPDSPEIWAEWERLALDYTATARRGGALVLWILAPPAETNGYYGPIESRIGVANDIYARVAACSAMVGTIDWGLLAGSDGGYADALPDANGELITVRSEDGLHFTEAGQALLADLTRSVSERSWGGRSVADVDPCAEPQTVGAAEAERDG